MPLERVGACVLFAICRALPLSAGSGTSVTDPGGDRRRAIDFVLTSIMIYVKENRRAHRIFVTVLFEFVKGLGQ